MTLDEAIQHCKEVANEEKSKLLKVGEEYVCSKCADEHEQLAKWLEELKEYKDLKENGQLVKLPCKIGDFMYDIDLNYNVVIPIRIDGVVMHKQYNYFKPTEYKNSCYYKCCTLDNHGDVYEEYEISDDEINKTVFLTEEDAKNELTRRHFNESRIK